MNSIFLYYPETTEFCDTLRLRLIHEGYRVEPTGFLNGDDLSYDICVVVASHTLEQYEQEWQHFVKQNYPIVIVKTEDVSIPQPLRLYPVVQFSDGFDAGFTELDEQLHWLTHPIMAELYNIAFAAAHQEPSLNTSAEAFPQPQNPSSLLSPSRSRSAAQPHSNSTRWLAVAAAMLFVVGITIIIAVSLPKDRADFVYLTPLVTRSATPVPAHTETPVYTNTPTQTLDNQQTAIRTEECCVTPSAEVTPRSGQITPDATQEPFMATKTQAATVVTSTATVEIIVTALPSVSPTRPGPRGSPEMDTDRDGIIDIDEMEIFQTNVTHPDTDGDGIVDGVEVFIYFTDPLSRDTDGDGFSDSEEIRLYHTDPNSS